ncbi:hypothetical protein PINS_up012674 [Pythium insidiosum]|nr:hypothetical protein PINS_up012674 [Pythium insidiosum]
MFYHAYNGYLRHAFPRDTLKPVTCTGAAFELGKIEMLTLIDTLDTLAILEDGPAFRHAVALVVARSSFDVDTEVSVFETTIRVLGGLLSAHLFAEDPARGLFAQGDYRGELLELARDLGDRLLPAFETPTGIPFGTVNLRRGVPEGETPVASTAGAGSLSLEFTMLSVLTGDARYAAASRRAVRALFERRSRVGLLGKHIDSRSGEWTETVAGVGSNADSFYEYLWKMYALFGDDEALEMLESVYPAVLARNLHGDWYSDVSMWSGCGHGHHGTVVAENLAAFWPGMQATMGHVQLASRAANAFYRVWRDFGFVPEQFNVLKWRPLRGSGGARYPLRPELIESTFFLHEATRDPTWLRAGAHVVHSLQKYARTPCGYAGIRDVERKTQEDLMPSFFLSETCKYLYLLFNTTHFARDGRYVFTTEAHPFPLLDAKRIRAVLPSLSASGNRTRRATVYQCRRPPFWLALGYDTEYEGSVVERTAACSVGRDATRSSERLEERLLPALQQQLLEHVEKLRGLQELAAAQTFDEDEGDADEMTTQQLVAQHDAFLATTATQRVHGGARLGGFRVDRHDGALRVTRDADGEWLEAVGLLDPRFVLLSWRASLGGGVAPIHRVYDFVGGRTQAPVVRHCELSLSLHNDDNDNNPYVKREPSSVVATTSCVHASFGAYALERADESHARRQRTAVDGALLVDAEPLDACVPLSRARLQGNVAVVQRGTCYFETKARNAAAAGAVGVIVINVDAHDDDHVMVMAGSGHDPGADDEEAEEDAGETALRVPVVMVSRREGESLLRRLRDGKSSAASSLRVRISLTTTTQRRRRPAIRAVSAAGEAGEAARDDDDDERT